MANVCLLPKAVNEFKKAITDGRIDPYKLNQMTSEERRAIFGKIVGEDGAKDVNSLFESKMLLKNQKLAYTSWAKKVAGITPQVRRDLLSRIERLDERILNPENQKAFLSDLAETKLGVGVSHEEAKTIADMSNAIAESRTKMQSAIDAHGFTKASEDARLQHAANQMALQNHINALKAESSKLKAKGTLKQIIKPSNYWQDAKSIMGAAKGLVASFTSHAPLKHGFMALFENPKDWARNYVKQFSDATRQVAGKDVMSAIKTEGMARENYINGIYDKWIPGELIKSNEEFHNSLVEKVPILGSRLYKGSKTMFDGFNLRMRMDMVDHYVNIVKKMGLDPNDKEVAKAWGKLAIDQTGGKTTNPDNLLGNFVFSQRLLKSQANNLTAHLFDKTATKEVKIQAAKSLAKMVAGLTAVIVTANAISPGSAEFDPRSTNFGKIKVGDTKFDIGGGMGSMVSLAARIAKHSTKSATTGVVNPTGSGLGQTSFGGLIGDFLAGRGSPTSQLIGNYVNGQTYSGQKPTIGNQIGGLFTPIPVSTYQSLKDDPNSANILAVMIAQQLGLMSNTRGVQSNSKSSLDASSSISLQKFKSQVGADKFKQLGQQYDAAYNSWLNKTRNDPKFKAMSPTEQQKQISGEKSRLKKQILVPAGYKVLKGSKTSLLNQ